VECSARTKGGAAMLERSPWMVAIEARKLRSVERFADIEFDIFCSQSLITDICLVKEAPEWYPLQSFNDSNWPKF